MNDVIKSIKYENFRKFSDEKPKELRNCIIIWGKYENENTNVMCASYYPDEHLFRDGLGGCLDEDLVRYWTYDDECVIN